MKKITKTRIKKEARLKKLEEKMISILNTKKEPIKIKALKAYFPKKASLETTQAIVDTSDAFKRIGNDAVKLFDALESDGSGYVDADISYTITGGDVRSVHIDGQSGTLDNGTIYGVKLYGSNYEFELEVTQVGNAQWTFTTNSIDTENGQSRSLFNDVVSSDDWFSGNIPTTD